MLKPISLRLEYVQYEQLRALSFVKRKPMSQMIREAVTAYLKQQPIEPGQEWFWAAEWQAGEREADADLAAGRFQDFDTMEEFLKDLGLDLEEVRAA